MQKTDWCIYVPLEGLLLLQVLLHTPQKLKVASNPAHWRLRIEIECCICLENCYLMISCSCMYVICHKIQACKKCFWKLIPFNSTSGWKVSPLVKTVCSFRDPPMVFTGRYLHCTRRIALIARCQKSNFWKKWWIKLIRKLRKQFWNRFHRLSKTMLTTYFRYCCM